MAQLLIQGGRVIDPASGFDRTADVLIEGDTIVEIGRCHAAGIPRIDAEGCVVAPGLIDPHVHLREPDPDQDETIATGSAAAINGGFTAVCCMPNTRPPVDTADRVARVRAAGQAAGNARVFTSGCASVGRQGREPAPIDEMTHAGAVAFTDDGDCVTDGDLMAEILVRVRAAGRCFMQHCQDPARTEGAVMNAGALAEHLGLTGWPAEAETSIIRRDLELNANIGCRYHAQHLSAAGSVEPIRAARRAGLPVTAEVAPHHLLLTEELCRGRNTLAKVNPPLRTAADITALKKGVEDGTITVLATDHAPHPAARKQVAFEQAAFGMVGLECALPLYVRALVDDGVIGLPDLLAMMTCRPAALLGLDRMGLGALGVGGPADVTVIDPRLEWTIRAEEFTSAGRNCPYEGWRVRGRAVATIVAGRIRLAREPQRIVG